VTNRFGVIDYYGASMGVTRNVTPALRLFARYDFYIATLNVGFLRFNGDFDNSAQQDRTTITKAVTGIVWDRRVDSSGQLNPLAPVKGWFLSGELAYAHPNGTGSTPFLMLSGQAIALLPFKLRKVEFTLIANARYDHGIPLGGESALPLVERLYAGGDTTTRGYDTDTLKSEIVRTQVSPLGFGSGYRIVPEGGNIRFLNTIELQFPVAKSFFGLPLQWVGAVFWDVGAITNSLNQLEAKDFRHSVGVTLLRLITPVGPMSLEYAYPLTQTLAEERWKTAPWYSHWPGRIHFNWGIPLSRL
jgi:outer membrane protein assembly factor BamA